MCTKVSTKFCRNGWPGEATVSPERRGEERQATVWQKLGGENEEGHGHLQIRVWMYLLTLAPMLPNREDIERPTKAPTPKMCCPAKSPGLSLAAAPEVRRRVWWAWSHNSMTLSRVESLGPQTNGCDEATRQKSCKCTKDAPS